jgi:NAD(P)-dependent dehydrogenase (short-subunit alcohol dehydrogenase family)
MQIEHSVALVTGANRGLGKAFVNELLDRGAAKVYAAARNPASVELTDARIVPVELDVTSPEQIAAAAASISDLTLLVNNAGVGHPGSLLADGAVEGARADFETNVLGVLAVTGAFAPQLGENGGGAVVNMLSVLSFLTIPHLGGYAASKSAAWSITNGLRIALAEQGTQVVGVHAGYIDTDLAAGIDDPKLDPADVAVATFDGVEEGSIEVLVDELSQQVKGGLSAHPTALYPALA